jgi:uncharacterized protein (TIGR03435 family)
MIRTTTALILASMASLFAQTPQRSLTFDVTSVRPNTSGEQGGSSRGQPGRYVGVNVTMRRVMGLAYLPVQEIVGGPSWINTERFDIEGRAEGTPNQEQMREMLRSLLADRFKLVVHRETRQMPAYALTLARSDGRLGAELRPAAPCEPPAPPASPRPTPGPGCGGFSIGNGSMRGVGVTMTRLAAELPSATEGRHVVDRTGLSGNFDVTLTWNADALRPDAPPADQAVSIFAAVQEQLGLKLEPITAPIEVLVIDSAERPLGN